MEQGDAKQRALAIARDLHALAASSYGPTGRAKMLQPNEDALDALEITTVAERMLARLGVSDCPVANVYLHILKSRVRNHCDGGLFTLLLSSKLQLAAQDGVLSSIPHQIVIHGFQLALEWCLAYLDDPCCPIRVQIDWSNTIALFGVLRAIISAKAVATTGASSQDALTKLLPLVVETFVSVLPFVTEHPGESLPIRFIHDAAYASSLSHSGVFKNSVLLNRNHHSLRSAKLLPLTTARVLLFSVSLDPIRDVLDDEPTAHGITISASSWDTDALSQQEATLRQLGDDLVATGANVVISQKLIPAFLQDYLARNGVVTVERLGITHMRAVQLLTGATALGDWRTLTIDRFATSAMGFLTSMCVIEANHQEMLLLQNEAVRSVTAPRSWPVATLVLSAHNEHAYSELVHVISSCFKRLEALMETPDVLAGAGSAEIHLAAWLRRNADHLLIENHGDSFKDDRATLRRLRSVIHAFADALESVVVTLDHGVHGLACEVIEKMRDANNETLHELPDVPSYALFGWDPIHGEPFKVATVEQRLSHRPSVSNSNSSSSDDESTSGDEVSDEADDYNDGEEDEDKRSLVSALVLDSLAVKRDALTTAVECATTLLRVGSVVLHTMP